MPRTPLAVFAFLLATLPAKADLSPVQDRVAFLSLVEGRVLTRIGIRLQVSGDGSIAGRALGRDVTGAWVWEDGHFCRTLDAGDREFARNCQVVSVDGDLIRFHADRGAGDIADFRLRD